MRMHHLYYELDAEDRKVYTAWLKRTFAPWAFILIAIVTVCAVLALDAPTMVEQRIAPYQQSGVFP
jgi:hypothetical protein